MGTVGVLLAIVAILVAIAWLRRRTKKTFDADQNLAECQAEFDDVEHDLARASELLDQAHQHELTWAEACRQLGGWATNPALTDLVHTPDGDEPAAQDLFETAIKKLKEVHAKAQDNLELAQNLVDDEDEEA